MAQRKRRLIVQLTDRATYSLEQIWRWNATHYGISHADIYIEFLRHQTNLLSTQFTKGKTVPGRSDLRYGLAMKSRSRNAYGHIIVFRISDDLIEVIDYFHTAQNWQESFDRKDAGEN